MNPLLQKRLIFACCTALACAAAGPAWSDHKIDHDGDGQASYADGGADCDDFDANRYEGNVEVCDALDRDEDCDLNTPGFRDQDGDGFGDRNCRNVNNAGEVISQGRDCNDFRRNVHPLATDPCNGRDDNCDGEIDDDAGSQFVDWDLDGHGNPNEQHPKICPGTAGYSPLSNDCDDTNPAIEPGDLVCAVDGETAILVCNSSGQFQPTSCPDGTVCVTQVAGNGACVPQDSKKPGKQK